MKLAALSDLHWPESGADPAALARQAREAGAQAVVLAGDVVSQFHPPRLREVLAALREAAPVRVYVPGNHELWAREGHSGAIYERHLPALCEAEGWHYLDSGPVVVDGVAIAGNVGWYDYSLVERDRWSTFQVALGAEMFKAARRKPCRTTSVADLTDEQLAWKAMVVIPTPELAERGYKPAFLRWNDGRWIRLGVTDKAFAHDCAMRLREHLKQASDKAERIVVATHTAPFAGALPASTNPVEGIMRAYQGASVLGDVIKEFPKVVLSVYGHRHRPGVHDVEGLPVINITARPDRGGGLVLRDV